MASVIRKVDACPRAKGLAIIITNDYIGTPQVPHKLDVLNGTSKDGENLRKTFTSLKFVVHWEHNVTKKRLEQIMYEVKHLKHMKVKDYKCVVLVFSGHGTHDNYVFMYDQERIRISDHLIQPLLPKCAKDLGNIPKLFFIDACRGSKSMNTVLVPKGKSASEESFSSRGSIPIEQLRVPEEANFLVAYSTMPDYKAYEDAKGAGGIWLSVLAEMIKTSPGVSILDVLTNVNAELVKQWQSAGIKYVQQPEQQSRLNKTVVLLDTEDERASGVNLAGEDTPTSQRRKPVFNIAAVFPASNPNPSCSPPAPQPAGVIQMGNSPPRPHTYNTPPLLATSNQGEWATTTSQGISAQAVHVPLLHPPNTAPVQYQRMLSKFASTNCTSQPSYETMEYFSREHNQLYFKSRVTVHLRNGLTIREDSQGFYITQQLSVEEAAKNACEVIAQRQMHHQQQQAQHQYNGVNQQWPQAHNPLPACSVSTAAQQVYPQPQPAATGPLVQQSYNRPTYGASVAPQPSPWQQNPQSQVSGKGPPPSGSDRERLNYFFQTKKITPEFDYVSDNTGSQPRYRCTIKYFMNGKTERVDSGGYFNSKAEAKEIASKKVLNKEAKGGTFEPVSRGKNTTPQEKLWKSKLKKFYDKRGQPNAILDYKTSEVALGRYQSTVFTSDFRSGVKGDVCDSKKEAEQNAAQKAVTLLN